MEFYNHVRLMDNIKIALKKVAFTQETTSLRSFGIIIQSSNYIFLGARRQESADKLTVV